MPSPFLWLTGPLAGEDAAEEGAVETPSEEEGDEALVDEWGSFGNERRAEERLGVVPLGPNPPLEEAAFMGEVSER